MIEVNISSHPVSTWLPAQRLATGCSNIIDIRFPYVDPYGDICHLESLAQDVLEELIDKHPEPCGVHVMGEMTLTHLLVRLLYELGYTPYAACTNRFGTGFKFIRFRRYPK